MGSNEKPKETTLRFIPGFSVKQIAAKSLDEDKEIVSETLARIYEYQGYYLKSIKIYNKLSLKYPEKNVYFAVRIKELKQNL